MELDLPPRPARYDTISDWYVPWVGTAPGLLCDVGPAIIPSRLDGQRWLDVACGGGRTSRELARRGATVVGVDLSGNLIAIASAEEVGEPLGISYTAADITAPSEWWDEQLFDGAICELAFMDIDDLVGTATAVGRVVRPGGAFRVSIVHPCFPGNEAGLSSWPPELGYAAEGLWTSKDHNPDGVRIRVGSNHRTLSTYINTFLDAGFALERFCEPSAQVPTLLVIALRRVQLSSKSGRGPTATS
jgi:2-polyprenyl-3-methyl-5-hydroxy-6-metoxy-1,4-benzoquinol methylase